MSLAKSIDDQIDPDILRVVADDAVIRVQIANAGKVVSQYLLWKKNIGHLNLSLR